MNYQEVLKFMFESLPMYQRIGAAAYKADLNTTIALDNYFGNPHKCFKTIHIAGTNGKGSVSHAIASVLQEAGYITGLYTSPHLVDYRERIRVNGEKIPENYVCDFVNNNIKLLIDLKPSFFEMTVALAFEYFRFCKVDVAVIEVGMGGRLDSTNIISPVLSLITNIGFDHTQFLGDTLDKIAFEKAGIIKINVPVIVGEFHHNTAQVFKNIAKQKSSEISFADLESSCEQISSDFFNSKYIFRNNAGFHKTYSFALGGIYQTKNLNLIINAILKMRQIGFVIPEKALEKGLLNVVTNTGLRGRWEKISDAPLTICDTGHNSHGLTQVINQILMLQKKQNYLILGFVNDKNVAEILKLFPQTENFHYYFTQASVPRAMKIEDLSKILSLDFKAKYSIFPDVKTAYKYALSTSQSEDLIFIGGSTFIVADFLMMMSEENFI